MTSKKITRTAVLITVCVLLGYVESLFPPIVPIPGIKIGIANAVVLFLIYIDSAKTALTVSVIKVLLCSLLFGSTMSLIYSLSGALISFLMMFIAKKIKAFSMIGVSSIGGIAHNMAQLLCAYLFLGKGVLFYIPPLCIAGAICGMLTGIATRILIKRGRDLLEKE